MYLLKYPVEETCVSVIKKRLLFKFVIIIYSGELVSLGSLLANA